MTSTEQADQQLRHALSEIAGLREQHKPGHAPLRAIYEASDEVLRSWVYADGLEGRSLQGREELQRRETDAATRRLLLVAWLTLVVSLAAMVVSLVAVVAN